MRIYKTTQCAFVQQAIAERYVEEQGLVSLDGRPIEVNQDGTVTLYHRTTTEEAEQIRRTGEFFSRENRNETYFSNRREGYAEDYGKAIVEVRVPVQQISLVDAFRNGEIHVVVSNDNISRTNIRQIKFN